MAQTKRKPNKEYTVKVKIDNLSRYEYDENSVVDLLSRGNYEEFSIAISMPLRYIIPAKKGEKDPRGSRSIGHIVSYNAETNEAVISIIQK